MASVQSIICYHCELCCVFFAFFLLFILLHRLRIRTLDNLLLNGVDEKILMTWMLVLQMSSIVRGRIAFYAKKHFPKYIIIEIPSKLIPASKNVTMMKLPFILVDPSPVKSMHKKIIRTNLAITFCRLCTCVNKGTCV